MHHHNVRCPFLLVVFLTVASLMSGQGDGVSIDYPYNPDADGDQFIGVTDVLGVLPNFGESFQPAAIQVDTLTLEDWLNMLQSKLDSIMLVSQQLTLKDSVAKWVFGKQMAGADFGGLDLRFNDMQFGDFQGGNFAHAKLSGANLANSDFRGANFYGADFGGLNDCSWGTNPGAVAFESPGAFTFGAQFDGANLTCLREWVSAIWLELCHRFQLRRGALSLDSS